jgi:hypothetical protein
MKNSPAASPIEPQGKCSMIAEAATHYGNFAPDTDFMLLTVSQIVSQLGKANIRFWTPAAA